MTESPFDPSNFDFSKMFGEMAWPKLDPQMFVSAQRRAVEGMIEAGQQMTGGYGNVALRQVDMLNAVLGALKDAQAAMTSSVTPQEAAAKQMELSTQAFQEALTNMTALAQQTGEVNRQAVETIQQRLLESLEELSQSGGT